MTKAKKPKDNQSPQAGGRTPPAATEPQGINAGTDVNATEPAANKPAPDRAGDAKVSASPAAAKASGLMVVVTGPKRGRWRAGRKFGSEPVMIPIEDLDEAAFEALNSDPRLQVVTREADPDTQ